MKSIIVIICTFCVSFTFAQNYHKDMTLAMQSWQAGKTTEAIAQFEQIATREKENWIPRYYQALVAVTTAIESADISEKKALIATASRLIPEEDALLNAEWLILKALYLTAELTIDPMESATRLSPQILGNYAAALQLDPKNPRAIAGAAEFNIRSKAYSGGSTADECEQLQKALSLFKEPQESKPFYPAWGQDRVEALLLTCNKNEQ